MEPLFQLLSMASGLYTALGPIVCHIIFKLFTTEVNLVSVVSNGSGPSSHAEQRSTTVALLSSLASGRLSGSASMISGNAAGMSLPKTCLDAGTIEHVPRSVRCEYHDRTAEDAALVFGSSRLRQLFALVGSRQETHPSEKMSAVYPLTFRNMTSGAAYIRVNEVSESVKASVADL